MIYLEFSTGNTSLEFTYFDETDSSYKAFIGYNISVLQFLDLASANSTINNSDTDPAYGIGARQAFGSFSLRMEYEFYDLDLDVDLKMTSI